MKVAFDIDQVLCMIVEQGRRIIARELGVPDAAVMVCDEYSQPFIVCEGPECLPVPVERAFWDRHDLLSGSEPAPGAAAALVRLHGMGVLAGYITRRPPETREVTTAWLSRHGFPDLPVHFVGVAAAVASYDSCKSVVCREIGATHLVDDHATELANASAAGIDVIVVDADTGRAARDEAMSRFPSAVKVADACAAADLVESLWRAAA